MLDLSSQRLISLRAGRLSLSLEVSSRLDGYYLTESIPPKTSLPGCSSHVLHHGGRSYTGCSKIFKALSCIILYRIAQLIYRACKFIPVIDTRVFFRNNKPQSHLFHRKFLFFLVCCGGRDSGGELSLE